MRALAAPTWLGSSARPSSSRAAAPWYDDLYIRESIVTPTAKVVGAISQMPTYTGMVSGTVLALVAYIQS
jgi:hypothetical protein